MTHRTYLLPLMLALLLLLSLTACGDSSSDDPQSGYVNRINSWFYTVLPWELGKNLQRKDVDDVEQLADLLGYKLEKK